MATVRARIFLYGQVLAQYTLGLLEIFAGRRRTWEGGGALCYAHPHNFAALGRSLRFQSCDLASAAAPKQAAS